MSYLTSFSVSLCSCPCLSHCLPVSHTIFSFPLPRFSSTLHAPCAGVCVWVRARSFNESFSALDGETVQDVIVPWSRLVMQLSFSDYPLRSKGKQFQSPPPPPQTTTTTTTKLLQNNNKKQQKQQQQQKTQTTKTTTTTNNKQNKKNNNKYTHARTDRHTHTHTHTHARTHNCGTQRLHRFCCRGQVIVISTGTKVHKIVFRLQGTVFAWNPKSHRGATCGQIFSDLESTEVFKSHASAERTWQHV